MPTDLVNSSSLHPLQVELLLSLRKVSPQAFAQLQPSDIDSDLLSYHLRRLVKANLIEKESNGYALSKSGKKLSIQLNPQTLSMYKFQRLSVLLVLTKNEKVLVQQRNIDPFSGYWEFPTQKVAFGQSIEQAAKELLRTETGLTTSLDFLGINHKVELTKESVFDDKVYCVFAADNPKGKLKDATNEAMRHWINSPVDTHYIIGSVVGPHPYPDMVARFQSVISKEIKWQLKEVESREDPDYVVACVGGGSNAAGAFFHYFDNDNVKLIAVEAAGLGNDSGESAATTVLGKAGVLHGSRTLLMQTADGQVVEPYSISAGLDYPGIGPIHAHLFDSGRADFYSATDEEAMKAGILLSRLEGIIPAIETAHALAALDKMSLTSDDIVVVNLSGRGDKDLETYIKWGKY